MRQITKEIESRGMLKPTNIPKGYKEMIERNIILNGNITTLTTFEEEEPISDTKKASEESLAYCQLAGQDLAARAQMPHFFRANIMSNDVKEQLEKTRDYLDYLQAEMQVQTKTTEDKTPYENLRGNNNQTTES